MKKNLTYLFFVLGTLLLLTYSCQKDEVDPDPIPNPVDTTSTDTTSTEIPDTTETEPTLPPYLKFIEPSDQRLGDPVKGKEYLLYGDYLASGVPVDAFKAVQATGFFEDDGNALNRTGESETVPYNYNLVESHNGLQVIVPNCNTCHSTHINGEFVLGLGNTTYDYSTDQAEFINTVELALDVLYGKDSDEWEAFKYLRRGTLAAAKYSQMDTRGVNPADQFAAILAAHRDPETMVWSEDGEPMINIPDYVVPTDVPAWWLLKKKNAMFFTGLGKGDFARINMAANLLTMTDTAEARIVDNNFVDVTAFLKTIEAPAYPASIDQDLAATGLTIFETKCQSCHGSYGDNEAYPNLAVDIDFIGTDRLLIDTYFNEVEYVDWFNKSWFGQTQPGAAHLESEVGYIAPPLDGIWATAPYLHNGSVPNLYTLLKSDERPDFWRRTFDTNDVDFEKMGWNYTEETSSPDSQVYDATLSGYGNQGHTFGDSLTEDERWAVIEYLKTL